MYEWRTSLEESGCLTSSRPSVEWLPLTVMLIVMEGSNGFFKRYKSSGGSVDAKLTVGLLPWSSRMIRGITNGVLVVEK